MNSAAAETLPLSLNWLYSGTPLCAALYTQAQLVYNMILAGFRRLSAAVLDLLQLCGKVDCEWDKLLLPSPVSMRACVCVCFCAWADRWTCSLVSRDIPFSVLSLCHGNQTGGLWWPTGAKWGGNNAALNLTLKNDFILSSIEQFLTPCHAYACTYTCTHTQTWVTEMCSGYFPWLRYDTVNHYAVQTHTDTQPLMRAQYVVCCSAEKPVCFLVWLKLDLK